MNGHLKSLAKNILGQTYILSNIHRNDVGANHYSHKEDLNSIFAGRTQTQNLAVF